VSAVVSVVLGIVVGGGGEQRRCVYGEVERPLLVSGDDMRKKNCPEEVEKGWGREQRLDGD
jgi:hypothetical protein